jgi:hypothetical protein
MFLQIFVGIPAMTGLYFFVRWLINAHSLDFGYGVVTGIALILLPLWFVEKYDPESFYGRRDRRLRERSGFRD